MEKTCIYCRQTKPISDFPKRATALDGHRNECKACKNAKAASTQTPEKKAERNARARARYHSDPEAAREKNRVYQERHAERKRARSKEYRLENAEILRKRRAELYLRDREKILSYFAGRKDKKAEYDRQYREKNKERCAAVCASWKARNPDKVRQYKDKRRARALEAGGEYTHEDIARLKAMQRGRCANCKTILPKNGYHVDHIVPLARGGSNWPENLQILCGACNVRKWAKDPIDFAKEQGRLL